MTTIANLLFVADTKQLDDAERKLTKLGIAASKVDKSPIKLKADTASIGGANAQFAQLSRNAVTAQSSVTGLGRSFDVFRSLGGPLGDVAGKITGMVGSLGSGVGGGLAKSLKDIVASFSAIKTSAAPANAALQETAATSADTDSALIKLGATYLALKGGKDLLAAADARANLAAAMSVAYSKKVIEAKVAEAAAHNMVAAAEEKAAALSAARPAGKRGGFNASKGRAGLPAAYAAADAAIKNRGEAEMSRSALQLEAHAAASTASWLRAKPIIVGAIGGITSAAVTGAAALVANAISARSLADDNAELAAKLGVTTTRLETLKVIAAENSGSVEGLQKVYDKLGKSMKKLDEDNEKTQHAFDTLGISIKDIQNLSKEELAGRIIQNFNDLGQSTKATTATIQLLGPAFREQLPALQKMGSGISDVEDRIIDYGATASKILEEQGAEQEVAFSNLALGWKGLSNEVAEWTTTMVSTIAQWAADQMNSFRKVLAGMREVREEAAKTEAIPQAERNALLEQAKNETQGNIKTGAQPTRPGQTFGDRFKELLAETKATKDATAAETTRFTNRADAARRGALQAKSDAVKPLKKDGPKEKEIGPLDWMKEPVYADLLAKAQAKSALKNAEYEDANKTAQDNKLAGMAKEHEAHVKLEEDAVKEKQSLLDKADSLRAQTDPNFAIIAQITEINRLEAAGALAFGEASRMRALYQNELINDQNTFSAGWENAFKKYSIDAANAAQYGAVAFESATSAFEAGILRFVTTGKFGFKEFAQSIITSIAQIYAKMVATKLIEMFVGGATAAGGSGWGAILTQIVGGATTKRASGGGVQAGQEFIVGEKGPEVLRMGSTSGYVTPNAANDSRGSGDFNVGGVAIYIQGGQTNDETAAAMKKELLSTMKDVADGRIVEAKRVGGSLRRA